MTSLNNHRWMAIVTLSASLAACWGDGGGIESAGNAPPPSAPAPAPSLSGTFANFQAPVNWLGQTEATTETGGLGSSTFMNVRGVAAGADGKLYVSDEGNRRVMVFNGTPEVNGAAASFLVGAPDFTNLGFLDGPSGISQANGKLAVAMATGHQVNIYTTPQASAAMPDVILGQEETSGCTATAFNTPTTPFLSPNGKLILSDRANHRVLIWNTVPTAFNQAPNLVLGQSGLTTCAANDDDQDGTANAQPTARTLNGPTGVWTDGTRLAIGDSVNNRVLIWNTFPTSSFQPADIVLGQSNFAGSVAGVSATRFFRPNGISWNGKYLAVADAANNRVLLWDGFPAASEVPASVVLGQPDFETSTERGRDALTLTFPRFVTFVGNTLFVSETGNRVTIFKAAP